MLCRYYNPRQVRVNCAQRIRLTSQKGLQFLAAHQFIIQYSTRPVIDVKRFVLDSMFSYILLLIGHLYYNLYLYTNTLTM